MADQDDERLLEAIARRNWLILAGMLLCSLLWRSVQMTLGVFAGGVVAIAGYYWLHRSLRRLLSTAEPGGTRRFQFGYIGRLVVLAGLLVLLLKSGVHPLGLAAGLSVVLVNILWTTIKRVI